MSADFNFEKYVATGNDFIICDLRNDPQWRTDRALQSLIAARVCDRHFGIGADGLVVIDQLREGRLLSWQFYNRDGSAADMCGNASRCVGRWAERHHGLGAVEIESRVGRVKLTISPTKITTALDDVVVRYEQVDYEIDGRERRAYLVNTGVAHAVVETPSLIRSKHDLDTIRALRFHAGAGPGGANVTFFRRIDENHIEAMTFERGVESFTLSCGTGALAAAAVALKGRQAIDMKVTMPGGELSVRYTKSEKECLSGAEVSGAASFVFRTALPADSFNENLEPFGSMRLGP